MNYRKIIFATLTALIPILLLAIVEASLWLLNAFPQPPLFIEKQISEVKQIEINAQVGERYFNKRVMPVPNLYPQRFSAEKSSGALRVFCLGGSTTAGFPYEMNVPFPQQLEFMLKNNYPDQEFEIINMGLSAINSFTVVDWIPEILDQSPDLIILYMGHNEFYGAYGTGSTISMGHNGRFIRLALKLQKLRLMQMMKSILRSSGSTPSIQDNPTLMEKVIDDRFIETNSILRMKTHENFAGNLNVILNACKSANVPVILSNLTSNIKDQFPLDITSASARETTKALELYQKGLKEFNQGDTATAYISLSRARDTDEVPFRGNAPLNDIIRDQADKFQLQFVDMENAFRVASPTGLPGNNLFCDHLHPNPLGYHLMAKQFYQALAQTELLPAVPEPFSSDQPLLVTDLDWEIGELRIYKLLHRWPFGNQTVKYSDYVPQIDSATTEIAKSYLFDHNIWVKAHGDMGYYFWQQKEPSKAALEYQAIITLFPDQIEYYGRLVECAKVTGQWDLVKHTCEQALEIAEAKGMFYYHLALSQRMAGKLKSAISNMQKAADAPELTRGQSVNVYYSLAQLLVDANKPMDAKIVLDALIQQAPDSQRARELLNKLNTMLN